MNAVIRFIMQSRWQAAASIAIASFLSMSLPLIGVLFSLISLAIIALVSLRRGAVEGLWVMGLVLLPATVISEFNHGNGLITLLLGIISWLPMYLIALLLRSTQRAIWAVQASVMIGVFAVLGIYGLIDDPAQTWQQLLTSITQPMMEAVLEADKNFPVATYQQALSVAAHYMTGISAAMMVSGLLSGLFLGRWWQALLYNPGGFGSEFLSLRANVGFSVALLILAVIANVDDGGFGEICGNLLAVLSVLFITVGIAVLHTLLSRSAQQRFLLPLLYVLIGLSIFIPHVMVVVALFGLIDTGLNLRNPISNQTAD